MKIEIGFLFATYAAAAPFTLSTLVGRAANRASPITSDCVQQTNSVSYEENGVVNGNCCASITIIYARGTTELGNIGSVAGPPMLKALRDKIGASQVLGQGVDYPANEEVGLFHYFDFKLG
jgi:hypothetical protein